MIIVDSFVKGWCVGATVGDAVLGNLTAIPGFIIDGIYNAAASRKYQYSWRSIGYNICNDSDGVCFSFSRAFALPGKIIGNLPVAFVFAVLAAVVAIPNILLRTLDKLYHSIKSHLDQGITFVARLTGEQGQMNYRQKSTDFGQVILGNAFGVLLGGIGFLIDQGLSLLGVDTKVWRDSCFALGRKVGGIFGNLISGAIGLLLYPVKMIVDKVFGFFHGVRDRTDLVIATLMAKNGYDKKLRFGGRLHDPHIYAARFRSRMASQKDVSISQWVKSKLSLVAGPEDEVVHAADGGFNDPITLERMVNPVIVCGNGHNADRSSGREVRQHGVCPCCRDPLLASFVENRSLRDALAQLPSAPVLG